MKNIKMYILFILVSIISICLLSGCGNNYDKVKEILDGETFYYNGGSDTSLNGLIFSGSKVIIKNVYYDGNGKHDGVENEYEYTIDKEKITINNGDLVVSYQYDGEKITLDDGVTYFREDEIYQQLKGYWNLKTSNYILGKIYKSQYNVYINDNKITYEYAALAYNTQHGYYYYGPYSGEYKLNFGGFDSSIRNGDNFFFNIIDNKVALLHFDGVFTESDGFPGEYGYIF